MVKDALKFFHAFIKEMIEIGGANLPRAISTKLGSKLAQIYKERGFTDGLEPPLKQMYLVLKANPTINKIDENTWQIVVKYARRFCPIGGKHNPDNVELFQQNICIPFTLGFLNGISSEFQYNLDVEKCIIATGKRTCEYCLKFSKKAH